MTLTMILLLVGAAACQKATTTDQSNTKDTTEETMRMTTQEKMDIFLTRRSIRKYKPELPSQELLDKVLEAGTYAPSAMGKQSVTIVAVTNRAVRDQLSQLANKARGGDKDQFYGAPAVFVVLADKSLSSNYLQDGALVVAICRMQLTRSALALAGSMRLRGSSSWRRVKHFSRSGAWRATSWGSPAASSATPTRAPSLHPARIAM